MAFNVNEMLGTINANGGISRASKTGKMRGRAGATCTRSELVARARGRLLNEFADAGMEGLPKCWHWHMTLRDRDTRSGRRHRTPLAI